MSPNKTIYGLVWTAIFIIVAMHFSSGSSVAQEDHNFVWQNGVLFSSASGHSPSVVGSVTGFIKRELNGQEYIFKTVKIPENFTFSFQDGESPEITQLRGALRAANRVTPFAEGFRAHQPDQKLSAYGFVFVVHGFELAKNVLDFTTRQTEQIADLIGKYKEEFEQAKEVKQKQPENVRTNTWQADLLKLRSTYTEALEQILLPHQIKDANAYDLSSLGVFEALTNTPIGKLIELNESQKDRLLQRTEALTNRINQEIKKARLEAEKIIKEELSDLQMDQLNEILPDIVDRQIKQSNLLEFLLTINFPRPKEKRE